MEKSIVPIEGTRILCVEDDPTSCNLLRLLLRKHAVVTAASIDEALGLAVLFPFNLYVLKAQYSDGSGIELCRQLRAFDASIPILFLSGDPDDSDIWDAMDAGARAFLIKPSGLDALGLTVDQLLKTKFISDTGLNLAH